MEFLFVRLQKRRCFLLVYILQTNLYSHSFNHVVSYLPTFKITHISMWIRFLLRSCQDSLIIMLHVFLGDNSMSSSISGVTCPPAFAWFVPEPHHTYERYVLIPFVTLQTTFRIIEWPAQTNMNISNMLLSSLTHTFSEKLLIRSRIQILLQVKHA